MPGVGAAPVALTGANQVVTAGPAVYRGLTLRATAAAVVRVWDNPSAAAGTLLDTVAVATDASVHAWYGDGGIRAARGIYVEVLSGTVEGSVRVG
jgi:hypothetical protein